MFARMIETGHFFVALYYVAIAIPIAIFLTKTIRNLTEILGNLKKTKRLRESVSCDVFHVEGEITSFTQKRLGPMDTQYNVQIVYVVGTIRYYKDVVLHNRGSIRVGQRVTLLCDSDDPTNAVLQGGEEEDTLKGIVFALALEIGFSIYAIWGLFRTIGKIINSLK